MVGFNQTIKHMAPVIKTGLAQISLPLGENLGAKKKGKTINMKRKQRKAFTIVELVIVIAVIGVLTAVLIPTFVNLTNKAQLAENQTFVKNINTQLAINEATEGKNKNPHEAIMDAFDMGFDVRKLTPVNGNDIIWDEENDRFAIVAGDFAEHHESDHVVYADTGFKTGTGVKLHKLWKLYENNSIPAPADQKYSIYAKGNSLATAVNVAVGFDAGENAGIPSVSYASTTGNDVVIRTKGGNLLVNGKTGLEGETIKHYGSGQYLTVEGVGNKDCYEEFGSFIKATLKDGKMKIEDGGSVDCIVIDDADADKVSIEVKTGGELNEVYAPDTVAVSGEKAPEAKQFITGDNAAAKGYAYVTTADELKAKIEDNVTNKIALGADFQIALEASSAGVVTFATAPVDKDVEINLNNHNVIGTVDASSAPQNTHSNHSLISLGGNSVLSGTGVLSLEVTGKDLSWNALSTVVMARENLTINNTVELIHVGGTSMAYAIDTVSNHNASEQGNVNTITMNGGRLKSSNYTAVRLYQYSTSGSCDFVLNGGTLEGKRCFYLASQGATSTETAKVTINGGKLSAWQRVFQMDTNSSVLSQTIKINGGLIECTAEENGAIFHVDMDLGNLTVNPCIKVNISDKASILDNGNKMVDQLGVAGKEHLLVIE